MGVVRLAGEFRAVTMYVEPCQVDLFKGSGFVAERLGEDLSIPPLA